MTIRGKYSFADGERFITDKYPHLLSEIEQAVQHVDAEKCRTKQSKEKTMSGKMSLSPVDLNEEFGQFFTREDGAMLKNIVTIRHIST